METYGLVKTCKFVTKSKFQTVEFLNDGLVRTSGLSLFTNDLQVDVKLLLDLHVTRSFVDNLENVARSQILITAPELQILNNKKSHHIFLKRKKR